MAKITQQPTVSVEMTLTLNEAEMRALDALAGYGTDEFLKVFYGHLGQHYLKPNEDGLRSLFASVRDHVPTILKRAKMSREAFGAVFRIAEAQTQEPFRIEE